MTADEYLYSTISKYHIANVLDDATKSAVIDPLIRVITEWGGNQITNIQLSGSRAKGTAISLSSDIDLFISLKSDTTNSLKEIFETLYDKLAYYNFKSRKQNVSIGVQYKGHSVDLIPAKKRPGNTNDHSLYRNKVESWTQTNITTHIELVKNSGRLSEIVAFKIWRKLHGLEFPSIYLELTVLEALYNKNKNQPTKNFFTVLEYLNTSFVNKKIIDPANSNNTISDDLYKYEKEAIAKKAKECLAAQNWNQIIW
nr:nucleotidyltransferase [uncultured Anaeromusa sp.]